MFPTQKPFPQLLISPAQSQSEADTDHGTDLATDCPEDESVVNTETDERTTINNHHNNFNSIDIVTDDGITDSEKQWATSLEELSSRKSSLSSFNVSLAGVKTIKIPSFDSKMTKLSPIPLAITPQSYHGSALSVRSSISSR